jgi:solute carrier family 9B (sodium/hydrogen exchanger), member 1/2
MVETHEEVLQQKRLPRVGQTVRNRKYGTLWRVMEKRELWQNTVNDPPSLVPAIYLSFWRVKEGVTPGIGKMLGYAYTLHDTTFETNWEIVT